MGQGFPESSSPHDSTEASGSRCTQRTFHHGQVSELPNSIFGRWVRRKPSPLSSGASEGAKVACKGRASVTGRLKVNGGLLVRLELRIPAVALDEKLSGDVLDGISKHGRQL